MDNFVLHEGVYVCPTSAGAFYASASPEPDTARRILQQLLRLDASPKLTKAKLLGWAGVEADDALPLLYHMQTKKLIMGLEKPQHCPDAPLEDILPRILPLLSDEGKVLLADDEGFYVASAGFPHESAEELAALSASLGTLYKRYCPLLANNLGYPSRAWVLGDAAGNSQLGFWPLFVGDQRFSLVIGGVPRLNQNAFTQLIWVLGIRYGNRVPDQQ